MSLKWFRLFSPNGLKRTRKIEVEKIDDGETPTILIAEDSKFFRNQVKGYMTEVGYNVIEAEDGIEGLE